MTDAERLAERLRELLERATPGPWQQKYAKGYGMAQIWSDNASKKNDWNSDFVPGTIAYQCDEDGPGLGFDCDIQPQCATDAELIVEAVNGLPTLLARIAALEEALREIEESKIERPILWTYREDGKPSKHDRCIHDVWMYETCEGCIDAHITKALGKGSE